MSIIVHLLRSHASRRQQRKEANRQWERAALSTRAIQSRRYRAILAGILILIGTVAFVEIVLVPGSMIRRNVGQRNASASATATPTTATDSPQLPPVPTWMMTEEQKAKLRQQELQRVEENLRATHMKLGNACLALSNARDSLADYSGSKLHVSPSQHGTTAVAPALVDALANEPTAKVAWDRILQASDRADSQLRDARGQLQLVASRFTAASFLVEDDHDMNATIQQVEQARLAVEQARSCVDHIFILQRARAALAHQASLDTTTGSPK